MNSEFKKEVIAAIAAGDISKLRQLQNNRSVYDFLAKYTDADGKGSIPPEAWMELSESIDPEVWGNRKVQIIPGNDRVFILPDNGR